MAHWNSSLHLICNSVKGEQTGYQWMSFRETYCKNGDVLVSQNFVRIFLAHRKIFCRIELPKKVLFNHSLQISFVTPIFVALHYYKNMVTSKMSWFYGTNCFTLFMPVPKWLELLSLFRLSTSLGAMVIISFCHKLSGILGALTSNLKRKSFIIGL